MKRNILMCALLLLATSMVFSAPLTIEDAINSAKGYNADYALASRQYANAVAVTNRESSFTPSLSLTGSLSTGAGFFSPSGADAEWNGLSGSVGISTGFTFTGSSITEKKTKQLTNEGSYLTYENAGLSLEFSVIQGYISIATTRANLELANSSLENSRTQLENVQERYEAGLASELELVQAENALSSAEYNVQNVESSLSLYILSFENLTGIDTTDMELVDIAEIEMVELPTSDELFESYAYLSPTIKGLDLAARSAELGYSTAKNGYTVPTFNLSVNYGISGNYKTSVLVEDGFSDGLTATAAVSIPIDTYFPSSSAASTIKTAKNAAEDARIELANALVDFKYDLQESVQTIDLLEAQISNQEKNVSALEKQYELTLDSYNAGETTLSTLQTTENSVINAKYTLLYLKSSYLQSIYSLSQTLGISYSTLLEA